MDGRSTDGVEKLAVEARFMASGHRLSAMRRAYTFVLAVCVALGIAGVLVGVISEWRARRQLPPELQSSEAIQYHFDGAACMGCGLTGFTMVDAAILMGVMFAIIRAACAVTGENDENETNRFFVDLRGRVVGGRAVESLRPDLGPNCRRREGTEVGGRAGEAEA